jgi:hypothetical protein
LMLVGSSCFPNSLIPLYQSARRTVSGLSIAYTRPVYEASYIIFFTKEGK